MNDVGRRGYTESTNCFQATTFVQVTIADWSVVAVETTAAIQLDRREGTSLARSSPFVMC
jgi:hypothetical protein